MTRTWLVATVLSMLMACGESPRTSGSGNTGGAGAGGTPLGAPETVFVLPLPTASGNELPVLYHKDLSADFPEVDWGQLDRLYIPAASYKSIHLGGLPHRTSSRPLVITNFGGQVKVGGQAANYLIALNGGKNWILTGRYDATAKTGDAAFRGHAEGQFAHSQGSYGIYVDDAFSKAGLSGISIGGGASDFELELLEVARVEFAGIVAKTDNDGGALMSNVRLHDVYVHDTGSEGIYFGSTQAQPQHAFEGLRIYDNRLLRTGTEALQIGQLGDGCEVHNNVLGPAATRWRSAFQPHQDGNVQYGQRYGSSRFENNIVIGTGDLFVEVFPTVVAGDPRSASDGITFANNYFADSSLGGVYTHADDTGVIITFDGNAFTGFDFNYDEVYPDQSAPVQVFGVGSNSPNPHVLRNNQYEATFPFVLWTFPSVTQENNVNQPVARGKFRDFMTPALDGNYRNLEFWTDIATMSPDQRAVTYHPGDFVMYQGKLYEAITTNSGKPPDVNPSDWKALPDPADDVRLAPDSPHPGLGIRAR